MINAIGWMEGVHHYIRKDYIEIIEHPIKKAGMEIAKLFAIAEGLHANYYHNFLRGYRLEHRERVMELLRKLMICIGEP